MCVHMSVHATEEVLGSEDKIERLRLCSASASGSVSQDSCCDCIFKAFLVLWKITTRWGQNILALT